MSRHAILNAQLVEATATKLEVNSFLLFLPFARKIIPSLKTPERIPFELCTNTDDYTTVGVHS